MRGATTRLDLARSWSTARFDVLFLCALSLVSSITQVIVSIERPEGLETCRVGFFRAWKFPAAFTSGPPYCAPLCTADEAGAFFGTVMILVFDICGGMALL